ncbi:TPA: hypothetical protein NKT40_001056 [Vibrio parahaemolyticus]|uniref:hypothetical protein n=1 Tax=Vibrio alginolyticus TaxID=663 RepID=UPI001BD46B86|nr:hypothetical protein [Vibrio alginolyticus]MBS9955706.1 hypothetical protein [Vibrio alginolyticus]HCH2708209.1 hypothetical protein [Vibrio parahaemolyticus]
MTQKEILESLTKEEQEILQAVLNLEQTKLNIVDLVRNSSEERKLVKSIYSIVESKIKK